MAVNTEAKSGPFKGRKMAQTQRMACLCTLTMMTGTACTSMGVEPWERDVLVKEQMQLVTDPVEAGIDDHIYFSKEASSGGRGFGGGGCGCN